MTQQPPNDPHRPYQYSLSQPVWPPATSVKSGLIDRLSPGQKAIGIGVLALLLLCGGMTLVGALVDTPQRTRSASDEARQSPRTTAGSAPHAGAVAEPAQQVETQTVTETQEIPFETRTIEDSSLAKGTTKVRTPGAPGTRTLTYEVTIVDGVQTGKKLLGDEVTKQPVTEVIVIGTKATAKCDPNYIWACVPIADDVDCAGGNGNGPAYVAGPVKVVGEDIYDLDRDGDGIGCE